MADTRSSNADGTWTVNSLGDHVRPANCPRRIRTTDHFDRNQQLGAIIVEREWSEAFDTYEVGNQLRQASPLSCLLADDVRLANLDQVQQEKAFHAKTLAWANMAPVG